MQIAYRRTSAGMAAWIGVGAAMLTAQGCGSTKTELLTLPAARIVMRAPPPPIAASEPERVVVTDSRVEIDQKINFETWRADILDESTAILDDLAQVLHRHPEIARLEIQGHTAEAPGSRRLMQLSKQRAQAVRAYLIRQGIDGRRLVAKGYGASIPIADNESADGREQNRRVEFIILDRSKQGEIAGF